MYRKIFIEYLQNYNFSTELKHSINYVIKNEESGYLRAQLVLAWCDIFGGDLEKALPLALAVECIQSASLIQDDLPCMDNATLRRGRPCLHNKTSEATAILTSDILIIEPFRILNNSSNFTNYQLYQINSLLINTMHSLCEGQYLEFQKTNPSLEELLEIHKLKTASLFSCCCQLGTLAASYNIQDLNRAATYGMNLGLIYQILDDNKDKDGIGLLENNQEVENLYIELKGLLEKEASNTQNSLLLKINEKII